MASSEGPNPFPNMDENLEGQDNTEDSTMVKRSDAADILQHEDEPNKQCERCKNHCSTIESLKTDLQKKEENIMKLTSHVHKLETDHPTTNKKRRYGDVKDDMNEAMMQNSADKDIIIGNLKKEKEVLKAAERAHLVEIESLKKENAKLSLKQVEMERIHKGDRKECNAEKDAETKRLKEKVVSLTAALDEREITLDETLKSLNEKDWDKKLQDKDSGSIKMLSEMQKIIDTKFRNLESTISNIVEKKLDEKQVTNTVKATTATTPATHGSPASYASVVGSNQAEDISGTNFRAIMLATKNEELAEETEKKRRAHNLIIHGKVELSVDDDRNFVSNLIKDAAIGLIKIQQVERIGIIKQDKIRPIKLVLANQDDKEKILNNLRNLKGNDLYKSISVKEDFTFNERLIIREFTKKANEENEKESADSNYIWRVRGSPKNGLTLKRFIKPSKKGTNGMGTQ